MSFPLLLLEDFVGVGAVVLFEGEGVAVELGKEILISLAILELKANLLVQLELLLDEALLGGRQEGAVDAVVPRYAADLVHLHLFAGSSPSQSRRHVVGRVSGEVVGH
jgi:hypothetical protein